MKQKCGSYVCVQLLQTLNILFENINSETSSCKLLFIFGITGGVSKTNNYLLSNNNVNSIITYRFDFSDEEACLLYCSLILLILAYYISFLKTLSFKLNPNTIHFFFNEHTGDFPLYTEAVKFFNHSEGMVRIAVRTLTLNVFKGKLKISFFAAKSRDKLECLVAEHLDHIHYTNDILRLGITSLNDMLTDQMLNRLLLPLYLGSLVSNSPSFTELFYQGDGPRIRQASALFFISQIFLVITHTPLVERLACILFLGDKAFLDNEDFTFRVGQSLFYTDQTTPNNICNRTDEEKIHQTLPFSIAKSAAIRSERPWFSALLDALICSRSDYSAFFALCLLYGIGKNEGISPAVLECINSPPGNCEFNEEEMLQQHDTKSKLTDRLVDVIAQCSDADSKVRIVTLEICCEVLKHYSSSSHGKCALSDSNVATLISTRESVLQQLVNSCQKDDIFLDLFEDELQCMQNSSINVQFLSADSTMLRCPSNTPLSGIDFIKRLPCGPQECVRKSVRVYLILRRCFSDLLPEESPLSLATYPSGTVSINDCLNLSNSDMLACTVTQKDKKENCEYLIELAIINVMEGKCPLLFVNNSANGIHLQPNQLIAEIDTSRIKENSIVKMTDSFLPMNIT
uniref:FPL domain-containing protein n=1 Tax=Romanomermis culicivorax TaxID=13658 RepID=A0A915HJA7_ROMCU